MIARFKNLQIGKGKMEKTMNFEHRMNAMSKEDWMIKK
jgi:hypothetical protein